MSIWLRGHSNWEDLILITSQGLLGRFLEILGCRPDCEAAEKVLSDLAGH